MKIIDIKDLIFAPDKYEFVNVVGWVVTNRLSGTKLGFLELNDGSCFRNLQVVYKNDDKTFGFAVGQKLQTACAVQISGVIKLTPEANQPFELQAKEIILLADVKNYPLQKKEHSLEFLRTIAHVRHRSKLHRAVQLVRNELAHAIHDFFYKLGFIWLHTPIFTVNDSEGAGESFQIQKMDNDQEFFRMPTNLTVSGQLHAEAYALGFKKIYTFGPTFRAEKSFTNRHAAEFWMLEPEVSFATLENNLELIENLVKYMIEWVLKKCPTEMDFLDHISAEKNLLKMLKNVLNSSFEKIEYKTAIEILKDANLKNNTLFQETNIYFGMDLKTEHERYLCEKFFQAPVFVYNYHKDQKAFYMKMNDDNTTVAAADLLVPGIGELVGGSEREYRYDYLIKRCKEMKIPTEGLDWYLQLRNYGYYRSSGFGLGFDRFLMYITGIENIRDVIPFPRSYQQITC